MSAPAAGDRAPTEVRAYHVRTTLQLLAEVDAAALARVQGRLGAAVLEDMEAASRLAWLPGAHDIALWRAIDTELGQVGLARLARAVGLRHVRSGHLSGLLQGVVQLFGLTPAAIVRWIPRGFGEVHRGVGTMRVEEVLDTSARLVIDDLHPALAGQPWLDAVARSFEFPLDVCALDGECVVVHAGPDRAVLALRWRPRTPPST
jgi:hypothetical protein